MDLTGKHSTMTSDIVREGSSSKASMGREASKEFDWEQGSELLDTKLDIKKDREQGAKPVPPVQGTGFVDRHEADKVLSAHSVECFIMDLGFYSMRALSAHVSALKALWAPLGGVQLRYPPSKLCACPWTPPEPY